ncbi:NAD(P)/FAD-dependent oxidoreductase [Arthrobacter ginkgonis]
MSDHAFCDVLIIGGGIAGLSLASALAEHADVVLLEAEPTLAHHTSARSAQQLVPGYGPPPVRELTRATLAALAALPDARRLVWPSRFMVVGRAADVQAHRTEAMETITHAEACALVPALLPEAFESAALDTTSVRTDATALIEHHRALAAARGARILTGHRVDAAEKHDPGWLVSAGKTTIRAARVVNAAGAWADRVAALFGAEPLGLVPLRRTAAYVDVARPLPPETPMVSSADNTWYFRPEGQRVLVSPSEAVPSEPCDAQPVPREVDAVVAKVDSVTTLGITGVQRAWTGLRTEAPDGVPVVGFDPAVEDFFWLAGQGGFGFQTSSGIAALAVGLLEGVRPKGSAETLAALDPGRFRT